MHADYNVIQIKPYAFSTRWVIFQHAHLFFPFSDAVTESMSWFWFALYLRQTESQFTMRRLQKVQFEDGLQRARGVNVKFHI